MHCENGDPLTANCVSTHRFATRSKSTIGSPSLKCSQLPPKPFQRLLPSTGPSTGCFVVLSKTIMEVLTHCTHWVLPTAPVVSAGELVTWYGGPLSSIPLPGPS